MLLCCFKYVMHYACVNLNAFAFLYTAVCVGPVVRFELRLFAQFLFLSPFFIALQADLRTAF